MIMSNIYKAFELYQALGNIKRKNDTVVDYEYKFNIVKDSDIVKPDTTGYIVNE